MDFDRKVLTRESRPRKEFRVFVPLPRSRGKREPKKLSNVFPYECMTYRFGVIKFGIADSFSSRAEGFSSYSSLIVRLIRRVIKVNLLN